MSISTKGEYAARALLHLALVYGVGRPVRMAEIAQQQAIPKKYLEQILLLLKRRGFVQSKPGLNGGYSLALPPGHITMGSVIRVMDGPLAPVGCVSESAHLPCACKVEAECALRTVWQEARSAMVGVLDRLTLQDVAARARAMQDERAPNYEI